MARTRPAQTASLKKLLKSDPPDDTYVVYRGSIARTNVKGELLLRPHLSPMREWAVFRSRDLVGKPVSVPIEELAPRERAHDIVEIAVRRGAPFRHVQEWWYRVGTHSAPRGIQAHMDAASEEQRVSIASRAALHVESSLKGARSEAVFHGLIRRGPAAGEFVVQPEPGSRREWVVIKVADVLNPDALIRVPADLLPARLHRSPLYFVPLRTGAVVHAMWEKARTVSLPPDYGPLEPAISRRPDSDTAIVVTQGDCTAGPGACPPAVATGNGYPCSSAGAFCRAGGIVPCSGTCSTTASWVWTCRCDCC
jgi:hypothetical protein